ncbi:MAG TPA: HD domain-containing phosphohydrolase, partial [Nitrospiraceae bacterium]|nr:HD domain-containing phosphohydrolase [Nitrospiraceae bacterium]
MRELPNRAVGEIVLHHHERFDGSGYPNGLAGRRIPIGARIVGVAEVFDSLVSGGLSAAEPLSPVEAVERIASEAGKAFDPRVVEAFLAVWKQASAEWISADSGTRSPASVAGSVTS